MKRRSPVLGLVVSLLITFLAAAIGGLASAGADVFYEQLVRPAWAPPAWLFGPVWSVLYVLMGIAAWLVWRARGVNGARAALALFGVQLAANALWTWLFFGWRLGALAFAEILILWVLIVCTTVAFWRVRPLAGALLLPYLAWVTFAAALTLATWQMNPQLLAPPGSTSANGWASTSIRWRPPGNSTAGLTILAPAKRHRAPANGGAAAGPLRGVFYGCRSTGDCTLPRRRTFGSSIPTCCR